MSRALILGISGQDGSYLAQHLLSKNYEIVGTSRDAEISTFQNLRRLGIRDRLKIESVAVNDFRSVLQAVSKAQPDEIYNLSGQSSVALSFQQPVETLESIGFATLNVLEAIRFIGRPIKFYNACSSECFGDADGLPATETTPFRPRSPYALAKSTAFWACANYREAYKIFACSGILFNHESPLRPARFVTRKIIAAANRISHGSHEVLHLGNLSIERDWGWAPEYVQAMHLMLQQSEAEDYVIATGQSFSLQQLLVEVFSCLNLDWRAHVVVDPTLLRPSDLATSRADPGKAAQQLGWRAKSKMPEVVRMMLEAESKEKLS